MPDSYEQLILDTERCFACPLAKTRTQVVVDRGNRAARIAIVGESPGEQEDLTGLALVGPAGQELDRLCRSAGLKTGDRGDVIRLNVLRCRPPENVFPAPSVVKQCLPLLDRQLKLLGPRVVVLAGKPAAEYTAWRGYANIPNMADIAGRWILSQRYPDLDFLAIYHPSYLLRLQQVHRGDYRVEADRTIQVLEWAQDILAGRNPPEAPLMVGSEALILRARRLAGRPV